MTIWVDADALPTAAKTVLFRAAERCRVRLTMVANKPLKVPSSPYLSSVVVGAGLDVADDWIVQQVQAGDLVVTADIPLAAQVVPRGALALDPRGQVYNEQNVQERLALRDLMADLRNLDLVSGGGPPPYTPRDVQRFASQLNHYLSRP
jgi:uncharacterized protein YaiI (UPF0178 family)